MTTAIGAARRRRSHLVSLVLMLVIAFGSLSAVLVAGWKPKLGLDLAGGLQVVLVPKGNHTLTAAQANVAVAVIRNRVDGLGVSGATVQVEGTTSPQVVVQVPGVKNANAIINKIGKTAQLYFRPVLCFAPAYVKPLKHQHHYSPTKFPACGSSYLVGPQNEGSVPADPALATVPTVQSFNDNPAQRLIMPPLKPSMVSTPGERYVLGASFLSGEAVTSAQANLNQTNNWVVDCTLSGSGSKIWDEFTSTYFHSLVAIELDGTVYSAPVILPASSTWTSFGGQVEISGSLSQGDADSIAQALQYGSLPVPLRIFESQTVSPTLGHSALVAGLGAGLAGLLLVLLYVILYYRLLGFVVFSGLALTAALLWALISWLGRTSFAPSFDLAGVTGLIVSIGITVDSYIVYFERLKDETRAGRSVRTSLDRGFASAWRTVLAADTVSLLAAVLLYLLATASVRGFAFFLGLSTLLDVLVTWFYTRPLVSLVGRNDRLTSLRGIGMARGLAVRPTVSVAPGGGQ